MEIQSLKLVYFSPTGTTKAVAQGIASGINPRFIETFDVTLPGARKLPLLTAETDLLVIAVPVYMGRVPDLLNGWLNDIQARKTPAVCVVVYGNRAYENALLELKDIIMNRGGIPIAGAAFIGEHSFSDCETQVAIGRPNEEDLNHAEGFGKKIREKLKSTSEISEKNVVNVPGAYPYEGITKLWDVDFIEVSNQCSQCGVCSEVCPMGAVDPDNSTMIDKEKCITCCACIKNCPQNARSIKSGPVKEAQNRLVTLYKEPKEPEYFL